MTYTRQRGLGSAIPPQVECFESNCVRNAAQTNSLYHTLSKQGYALAAVDLIGGMNSSACADVDFGPRQWCLLHQDPGLEGSCAGCNLGQILGLPRAGCEHESQP